MWWTSRVGLNINREQVVLRIVWRCRLMRELAKVGLMRGEYGSGQKWNCAVVIISGEISGVKKEVGGKEIKWVAGRRLGEAGGLTISGSLGCR